MNSVTAKQRYNIHKHSAKTRGIDFLLSFDEWYNWWLSNGVNKDSPTQRGKNQPCMCRIGDVGPYSLTNIYFDTSSNNVKFSNWGHTRSQKKIRTPIGDFNSQSIAAEAYGRSRKFIWRLMKKNPNEYYYID